MALARTWGTATDIGAAVRVSARFERDTDARLGLLTEAVALLEGSPDRLEHTKALVDLAETFRTLGRRSESRGLLDTASGQAVACGSPAVQARCVAALEALGDRPRRLVAPGLDSLTASERRVAGLAVVGRTNRDIAHELFVSPKTVENHLGRVYTKLGITSRRELASVLG